MVKLKCCLVFLSLLCASNANSSNNSTETKAKEDKLILAHVIFRHGDRNPISSYPNDPWQDESNWPEGFGQLTKIGVQQEYELGLYLRERYQKLLKDGKYSKELIYVQSSDYDRTIMSAETVLAAIFPPRGNQVWDEDILWQPVPIHMMPIYADYVLNAGKYCPRFNRAMQAYQKTPEMVEFYGRHKELLEYLEENSGTPIRNVTDVENLYNTLWIEQLKNKKLPPWTESVFGDGSEFEFVANHDFKMDTATPELARLSIGFLINEILMRCAQKIESLLFPDRSLWIYSAHDTTIADVLGYFNQFDLHIPPYASSLHFELYKSENGSYLQVMYRNTSGEMLLEFPLCGTKCAIEDLQQIYLETLPTGTFEEECQLPLYIRAVDGSICASEKCLITLMCFAVGILLITVCLCVSCARRRGNIRMDNENMKYL